MNETTLPAVQKTTIPMVEGRGLAPQDFDGLWRVATILAASGVVPKDLHQRPEAIFVTMNMGAELGLSPMASLQNISVINGRPTLWGDGLLGVVRGSGQLAGFSETFKGDFPSGDFAAVCKCKRGDESVTREFSIDDAKAAGLWKYSQQGVTPWHKYPKRMLQMRARSWALRDLFADITKGISAREELEPSFDVDTQFDEKTEIHEPISPVIEEPPAPEAPDFEQMVNEQFPDDEQRSALGDYLSFICQEKGADPQEIKVVAAANFERFWDSFLKWIDQTKDEPQRKKGGD